jgi:F-type H+-transporting ATPase subunit alpha
MAFSLYAANEGFLNDVPANKIVAFEAAMHAHLKSNNADLLKKINDTADYNDEISAEMKAAIESFKANGVW